MRYWWILLMLVFAGCTKEQVKIIEVVPLQEQGWNTVYRHVVVENVLTKERHKLSGYWGNTGDVFVTSTFNYLE